jgi:hypothetical protein
LRRRAWRDAALEWVGGSGLPRQKALSSLRYASALQKLPCKPHNFSGGCLILKHSQNPEERCFPRDPQVGSSAFRRLCAETA